jgi:UDP-2,3-diacylglucosamine pyrophosphatase LpxH
VESLTRIRTLFISDVHLGAPQSNAEALLEVLKSYQFDELYIVGDFLDLTSLRRKFFWKTSHSTVIQKILRLSRKGVKVVYVVGNHDYWIRNLIEEGDIHLGDILICNNYIYTTSLGENIYVTHGDEFDGFVRVHPFLYWLGDRAYSLSMKINKVYNLLRKLFGMEYWSLSGYLKSRVKNAVMFLAEYKKMARIRLKTTGCQAILMGHIHTPDIIRGEYYNTGDFCESNTYIIENLDGELELRFRKSND